MPGLDIDYKIFFDGLSIEKGDVILVSSDMLQICGYLFSKGERFCPSVFMDTLQDIVGQNGTIVFPTYNWDFCRGMAFDYRKTKSKVGALSNAALARPDFKRTKHPIYSFAVWGKDKNFLCSLNNKSSFGVDSPFAYLYESRAKCLLIGMRIATFIHYIEEKIGVEYRFLKPFTAEYIDEDGHCSERTYSMYVRYLDRQVNVLIEPLFDRLIKIGGFETVSHHGCMVELADMRKAYDIVEDDILNNRSRRIVRYWGNIE